MTTHTHRAATTRETVWAHCVTPEECAAEPMRVRAHGNITTRETCACGAERITEINSGRNSTGWIEPDAE
jgi:hypothetical protein